MRAIVLRIRDRLLRAAPARFKPDFGDATFFRTLAGGVSDSPRLREALEGFAAGDPAAARTGVARHFRTRPAPCFFASGRTLAELAAWVSRNRPDWEAATLERVRVEQEQGLMIYSRPGPPLDPVFPWGTLPRGPGDDNLYCVRPQRFAFAPRMALAVLYGASDGERLSAVLASWMKFAATERYGLAYQSNLVVIQRLLALSWTWAFLAARPEGAGEADLALEYAVLKILHADARFLLPRLGKSFPNNHLLADGFAGWYLTFLFPELVTTADGPDRFEALWRRELERQIYPDGTSFEHSLHYHEFACEMAAAYVLLRRRNGLAVAAPVLERARRMLRFQADLGGEEGRAPAIGNATEDPLFALDSGDGWGTAAWREMYRALFDADLAPVDQDRPALERAFWLLGGALAPARNAAPAAGALEAYPDGGFFVFTGAEPGTRLVLRTGPAVGRMLCAGHAHADLLSVCLHRAGVPAVVDAGTYSYRHRPDSRRWRAYFAGPQAHNGLAVSGEDPLGELSGDFRLQTPETRVTATLYLAHDGAAWVEGTIIGGGVYAGYRRGVVQVFDEYWLIYDELPPSIRPERASLAFQLAPGARVVAGQGTVVGVDVGDCPFWIAGSEGLTGVRVVCGDHDPCGGWVSRGYGELSPAPQLRFGFAGGVRPTAFVLGRGRAGAMRVETQAAQNLLAVRIELGGTRVDYLLLATGPTLGLRQAWGIRFEGRLLWLRTEAGRPLALRCLDARLAACPALGIAVKAPDPLESLEIQSENALG